MIKQYFKRSGSAATVSSHSGTSPTIPEFEARFSPKLVHDSKYAEKDDIILFVHIPKTAGVSFGKSLQESFDIFRGVEWSDVRRSFQKQTRDALYARMQNEKRQVLSGHFGWPELTIWRDQELPVKAISVLRDPYERLVSNYYYNCSEKHPTHADFKKRFPTLRKYAESTENDPQLRQLIGLFYSFEHALEKLSRYYVFLGVTEKLDASLRHFSLSLGLPAMRAHRLNTASPASKEETTDPDVYEIVSAKSVNDKKLHDLLLSFYS